MKKMARRPFEDNAGDEAGGLGGAMTLYTTIMLILLSFFMILVSRANFDETKYAAALKSIQARFGVFVAVKTEKEAADGRGGDVFGDQDDAEGYLVLPETELAQIRSLLAPAILGNEARIVRSRNERTISLAAAFVFKPDSLELTEEMAGILSQFSRIVAAGDIPIRVEGHTGPEPPATPGLKDNWELSGQMALAVLDFLKNSGGLSGGRLAAFACASEKPLYSNASLSGRAGNKRVDLVLDFSGLSDDALKEMAEEADTYNFRGFDFLMRNGAEP